MAATPEERRALLFLALLIAAGSAVRLVQARAPRWTPDLLPPAVAPSGREPADSITAPASRADAAAADGHASAATDDARATPPPLPYRAGRLDLNAATVEDLAALPGIGEKLAARIVADREAHGSFARPEDLQRVPGIGPGKFARVRDAVTVLAAVSP